MDVRRALAAIAAIAAVCLLSWIGGFDFNERGASAFFIAYLSITFGVVAAAFPFKERK